jgi:hypothetical protein
MVLFGDVRQVEEVRERPRDRQGGVDRHLRQLRRQRLELTRHTGARVLRPRAHALDGVEERAALVRTQRLAQQLTEQTDVVAEGLVWIV